MRDCTAWCDTGIDFSSDRPQRWLQSLYPRELPQVKDRISVLSKAALPTTFSRRLTASYFLGFLLFGAWEFIVNRPRFVERLQDLRREFDAIRIEPGSSPELNLPSLSGRGVAKSRSAAIAKRYNSISTRAKLFS